MLEKDRDALKIIYVVMHNVMQFILQKSNNHKKTTPKTWHGAKWKRKDEDVDDS
jgi:hypothetical protein